MGHYFSKLLSGEHRRPLSRWALQTMIASAIASLFVIIQPLNAILDNSGYWAVQVTVTSIDETAGASISKCFERIVGTCVGGLTAYLFFLLCTWCEHYTHPYFIQFLLSTFLCLWPLPWGYVRLKFPHNPSLATYGTFNGYLILLVSFVKGKAHRLVIARVGAVCFGLVVTSAVVLSVWPNRARYELDRNLSTILECFADILRPLVEVQAGFFYHGEQFLQELNAKENNLRSINTRQIEMYWQKIKKNQVLEEEKKNMECRIGVREESKLAKAEAGIEFNGSIVPHYSQDFSVLDTNATEHKTDRFFNSTHTSYSLNCPKNRSNYITNTALEDSRNVHTNFVRCSTKEYQGGAGKFYSHLKTPGIELASSAPEPSSLNYVDEKSLEVCYKRTLLDSIGAYREASENEASSRNERWNEALKKLQCCRSLLNGIPKLIISAKKEIPCSFCVRSKPKYFSFFPEEKYYALMLQLERLFHHIASLAFSLDLNEQNAFSYEALPNQYFTKASPEPVYSFLKQTSMNLSNSTELIAGVVFSLFFSGLFGSFLSKIVEHICTGLIALSLALSHHSSTAKAKESIDHASELIDALERLRRERQMIYASVLTEGASVVRSHIPDKWVSEKQETNISSKYPPTVTSKIPWDILLGIEPQSIHCMTRQERELYWITHWSYRDRLSVTMRTLLLLRYKFYLILGNVDDINSYYQCVN